MANSFEIPAIYVYNNHGHTYGYFGKLPLIDIQCMHEKLPLNMIRLSPYTVKNFVPGPYIDFKELFDGTKGELPTRSIDDFLVVSKPGENKIKIYDRDYLPVLKEYDSNGIGWLVNTEFDTNPIIFKPVFELPAVFKKFDEPSYNAGKYSMTITPTQSEFELTVMNLLESSGIVSSLPQRLFFAPILNGQFASFDSSVFYKIQEYKYFWVLLDSTNKKFQPIRYIVDPGSLDPKIEPFKRSDAPQLAAFFANTAKQRNKYFVRQYNTDCKR